MVPVLHEGSTCHHQSRQAGDEGRMRRWSEEVEGYSSHAYGGVTDALKCTMYTYSAHSMVLREGRMKRWTELVGQV